MALLAAVGFDGMSQGDLSRFVTGQIPTLSTFGGAFDGACVTPVGTNRFAVLGGLSPRFIGMWALFQEGGAGLTLRNAPSGTTTATYILQLGTSFIEGGGFGNQETFIREGWNWVEVDLNPNQLRVAVNGLVIFSSPVTNSTDAVYISRGSSSSRTSTVDDIICWDANNNGDGFSGFPIGPQRIQLLQNSGPGDLAQWTPSSGDNWAATTSPDWEGGAGVTTSANNNTDLHEMNDMEWDSVDVKAVMQRTLAADLGAGGSRIQHRARFSSGDQASAAMDIPTLIPTVQTSLFTRQPGGGKLTPASINAMQCGYRKVV